MLELCFLLQLCVVSALPEFIARATSTSQVDVVVAVPTPPPSFHHGLLRRDDSLPLNVCGWLVGGKPDAKYTCVGDDLTCLWDNEKKTVGCGNAQSMPSGTTCYDYSSRTMCDENCRLNRDNIICSESAPLCTTVAFPNNFSMLLQCNTSQSASPSAELTVVLTPNGLNTPVVQLPRSIVNGVLAFATQFPSDYTSTSLAAVSAASASASARAKAQEEGGKVNSGSIIAAAVGGAVLLAGLPFGIKMFLRKRKWSKAQRPRRLQEREMRRQWAEPSNPYSSAEIPTPPPPTAGQNFLFSQDWHGKSKSAKPGATGATNHELQGNSNG